jgi:hypothetical protein
MQGIREQTVMVEEQYQIRYCLVVEEQTNCLLLMEQVGQIDRLFRMVLYQINLLQFEMVHQKYFLQFEGLLIAVY